MIPVTKTFLPPQEEYSKLISQIWESNQIANGGRLHSNLKDALKEHLKARNIILTANGTLPIQIALKILAKGGEIITTPFSYVATTSSIVWENCKPVFVDIDPNYLTIDEGKIEAAITKKTTAILATHIFGNPCHVEEIRKIAQKHQLKVIYDAAHAFGVKYKQKSIFNYGDVSTCSFHATKIFHTGEGGAMFCSDEELSKKLFYSHNFGHKGELQYHGLGINAKMNELQAAMGLAVLPYFDLLTKSRKHIVELYDKGLKGSKVQRLSIRMDTDWNYSYYPIIFESEDVLLKVQTLLNNSRIFPRRYFYPSLNTLSYIDYEIMEFSEDISRRIMCLPLYMGLDDSEVEFIINKIQKIID